MLRDEIVQTRLGERGNAVRVITTPPNNDIDIDTKPSPQLIEALRAFPGVAGIEHGATIGVVTTDGYVGVSGGMGRFKRPYEILDGRADAEAFERGEVLIGPVLARERSLRGGGTLELPGRDGMARVRVQGVWANGDFNGSEITMPLWLLDDLWGPQPPEGLAVEPEPGVDPADLAARIRASGLDRHLIADAPADQLAAAASDLQGFFEPFWALQRALLLIAFAAVLFTLLLAAVQRRRELSLLAAVGMAPGSLARMILAEAAAVAVVGTVLGTVTALGVLVGFRDAFFLFVPYRVDLRPDMTVVPVYGAITLAILVLAAAWPAWQTTRLQPAQALRYE
jgi:putative ABC transport system permease protein